jgi:hypothetical protein
MGQVVALAEGAGAAAPVGLAGQRRVAEAGEVSAELAASAVAWFGRGARGGGSAGSDMAGFRAGWGAGGGPGGRNPIRNPVCPTIVLIGHRISEKTRYLARIS